MAEGTTALPTDGSSVPQWGLLRGSNFYHPRGNADNQILVEAGYPRIMATDVTRPANTTAYAAYDVVGDNGVITFTGMARSNGGAGWLTFAQVVQKRYTATPPTLELWVFGGNSGPAAINDNAEFSVTTSEAGALIARIPLSTVTLGFDGNGTETNGWVLHESGEIRRPYECGSTTTSLWGVLRTTTTYTPVSGEVFRPCLSADVR